MQNYQKSSFSASIEDGSLITHDVYSRGDQPRVVVIIQELPGIGPETLVLAEKLHSEGFRVVLPHLFGPLGRVSMVGNMARVFCLRKEFKLFEKSRTSPIVDWLKKLCQDISSQADVSGVGVIGMCLTGNFAISLIADDAVSAAVASQPSLPLFDSAALHMSTEGIAATKKALTEKGPMMALRFERDPLCTAEKFSALDNTFNNDSNRIRLVELPGKGHSVLTLDFMKGGEPARKALEEVIDYFNKSLESKSKGIKESKGSEYFDSKAG